jgi:fido (protein-threonine AMPylation protein)
MSPAEKIAAALSRVRAATKTNQGNIVKSQQITRADRELLVRTKWLNEIMKGWYLLVRPDLAPGDSSAWYASFWEFLRIYLHDHLDGQYCLSAESSLDLHTGSTTIPRQVIVIAAKGGGTPQELPFNTSLFIYSDPRNIPEERIIIRGLQVMPLPYALCKVSPSYFQKNSTEAEIALQLIRSPAELTQVVLKHNFQSAAARIIGAYDFLGNHQFVEELTQNLVEVGLKIKPENPFQYPTPLLLSQKLHSPYVARILSLWNDYREKVLACFPPEPGLPKRSKVYMEALEDIYEKDAYNSLSIEGYQVNEELIVHVQNNEWNPDAYPHDHAERNALAARGYYEAFLKVKQSLLRLFQGENPGAVIEKDLKKWYHQLFSPMARAGMLREEELFGYRKGQVYIRHSRHVPLPKEALIDAMETLFDCLKKEPSAAVRAVLGHYIFVYIHPYMDGNGRIGRFLMNAMFASGGYPWTIIQVKNRIQYLQALEMAGPERNIEPFAQFVAQELSSRS